MTRRFLPLIVAVAALAALVGTISYAVARAGNGGNHGYGSMMNGSGYTMMGGSAGRSTNWYLNGSGPVRTIAAARAQAQRFADRLDLKTGEVMQFANNFYVLLTDSQGKPATEIAEMDIAAALAPFELGKHLSANRTQGVPNMIALINGTAARLAAA